MICLLAGLILFASASVHAATLEQYRGAVRTAKNSLQSLLAPDDEDLSTADYERLTTATVKGVRAQFPATETVEFQGATITADNRWLAENLDQFERARATDDSRWEKLTEIVERLEAIERQLDQLANAAAATRTKDEDKQKLGEILRREAYQKPEKPEESLAEKIERTISEWFDKLFPRPSISPSAGEGFKSFSVVLQGFLYALLIGALGFAVYRFAPFFIARFGSREKGGATERVILGERLAADETAQNLFAEAEKLARAGDLRGAIRQGYIALLCDLSDRRLIQLSRHKTNRDYLRDVRQQHELHRKMSDLTADYERHWYGFEQADATAWDEFKSGCQRAVGNG